MGIDTKQLLDDMIAVRLDEEPATKSQIKLPDWQKYLRGTVVAAGPGAALYTGGRAFMSCKVGDVVSFPPTAGMTADLGIGASVVLMRDSDVDCVWDAGS